MMSTSQRRRFISLLAGVAAGLLPVRVARAQSDPFAALVRDVTGGVPVWPGRVKVETPLLADNGHSVPLKVSVASPMTAVDHVRSITLLSEKNPRPVIAKFIFGQGAGRAEVVTRVRLNGAQRLLALAQLSDGSFWSGGAEVVVTESACLDES